MKKRYMSALLCGAIALWMPREAQAQAQNSRMSYFLKGATYRHELNPAFMGERGYVSLPALGNFSFGAHTTAGVGDFLYPLSNGDLGTFMHPDIAASQVFKRLPHRAKLGFELDESLLSLGFYGWGGFNTLGISLKSNTSFSAPEALFRFMKAGVDAPEGTHYRINGINLTSTNYAEIALGHARPIDDRWTVGAKLKFLVGLGKASLSIDRMDVTAAPDHWEITPSGATMNIAAKGIIVPTKGETGNYDKSDYVLNDDGTRGELKPGAENLISYDDIDYDTDNVGPTGFGMAVDMGAEFRMNDQWTFSASLLDLGFISWTNNIRGAMNNSFSFDGFHDIAIDSELGDNDPNSLDNQADRVADDMEQLYKFSKTGEGLKRTTALAATMLLGAEYTLPAYDRLSFGGLWTTRFMGRHTWTEARVSANISPLSWFEASLGYALSSFGSTGGLMLNFHPRGFNFFLAADVPLGTYEAKYYAPVNRAMANFNLGINFTFGPKHKPRYKCRLVDTL